MTEHTDARAGSVVVGYDGSPRATRALDWAAAEAGRKGLPLTVVQAIRHPEFLAPAGVWPLIEPEALAAARDVTNEGVERAAQAAGNPQVSGLTVAGHPADVLLDAAKDASLLVVGTRGRGDLVGALLGSVAFAVSSHAPCPVVVVRGSTDHPPGPQHPVVVGVDGSKAAEIALRFAADAAAASSAPLDVVTAWHPLGANAWELAALPYLTQEHGDPDEASRKAAEQVAEEAGNLARALYRDLTVTARAVSGQPADALAQAAKDAGLLVVGSRGRGGFTSLVLGSTGHAVIHVAPCPVAVVRAA